MIFRYENWYDRNARSDSAISPPPNVIFKDFLYLSSAPTAAYLPHLLNSGITHIINLSSCSDYWADQNTINIEWKRIQATEKRFYASLVRHYGRDLAASSSLPFGYAAPIYHHIDIEDTEDSSLAEYFPQCITFITQARLLNPKARILIHCYQGRSRSASVAMAYVMWACRFSFDDAFHFVKERRPSVSPNPGFLKQLAQFDKDLKMQRWIRDQEDSQNDLTDAVSVESLSPRECRRDNMDRSRLSFVLVS